MAGGKRPSRSIGGFAALSGARKPGKILLHCVRTLIFELERFYKTGEEKKRNFVKPSPKKNRGAFGPRKPSVWSHRRAWSAWPVQRFLWSGAKLIFWDGEPSLKMRKLGDGPLKMNLNLMGSPEKSVEGGIPNSQTQT